MHSPAGPPGCTSSLLEGRMVTWALLCAIPTSLSKTQNVKELVPGGCFSNPSARKDSLKCSGSPGPVQLSTHSSCLPAYLPPALFWIFLSGSSHSSGETLLPRVHLQQCTAEPQTPLRPRVPAAQAGSRSYGLCKGPERLPSPAPSWPLWVLTSACCLWGPAHCPVQAHCPPWHSL